MKVIEDVSDSDNSDENDCDDGEMKSISYLNYYSSIR